VIEKETKKVLKIQLKNENKLMKIIVEGFEISNLS